MDPQALLASLPANSSAKFQYGSIALTDMATAPALLKMMLKDVDVVIDESKHDGEPGMERRRHRVTLSAQRNGWDGRARGQAQLDA